MSEAAAKKLPAIDLDDFERRLRHAPQTSQADADPLSELARLVSKDDPFKSIFDDMPTARASHDAGPSYDNAPPPASNLHSAARIAQPVHQQDSAEAQRAAHDQAQAYAQSFDNPPVALTDQQDGAGQAQPTGSDPAEYYNAEADGFSEAAGAGRRDNRPSVYGNLRHASPRIPRKAMIAGMALSVVAIAGVAAAVGFRGLPKGRSADSAPVIRAAVGPAKVQPPQAEGADPAAALSVLDKANPADGVANVKVVSREEQPSDIAPTVKQVKTIRVGDGAAPAGAASPPNPSLTAMPEPKRVKTVLVRPDGSIIGEPGAAAAGAPSQTANVNPNGQTPSPKAAEVKPPVKPAEAKSPDVIIPTAKSVPAQKAAAILTPAKATARVAPPPPAKPAQAAAAKEIAASGPLQLAPAAGKGKAVKTAAADPAPAVPAEETVQTTSSTGGGSFAVQLAAPASEQEAKDTSSRLQKQYAGALGSYLPGIRKASDKEVYRVRVGNLSKDEADALCGKLKAAGGACFVARN